MLRPATLEDQSAPAVASRAPRAPSLPAPSAPRRGVFLTAQWRNLAILNWAVDPELLAPHVPSGVELDFHGGKSYVSMVGFQFLDARLLGLAIPFHRDFEEVNLRFYVLRRVGQEVRRGVVFIREICPRWAVSAVARLAYNERYMTRPMTHRVAWRAIRPHPGPLPEGEGEMMTHRVAWRAIRSHADPLPDGEGEMPVELLSPLGERLGEGDGEIEVEYAWRHRRTWHRLQMRADGAARTPRPGSLEEFIVEHYWAYTRQRDGGTVEYRVAHLPWRTWAVRGASLAGDFEPFYGHDLAAVLRQRPQSAILAEGSPVSVYRGARIDR